MARFIVGHARLVIGVTAALSVLSLVMLLRMSFNADISSFLLEGNSTGEEFAALQAKYATSDPINVIASLPDGETIADSGNAALVAELRDTLGGVEGVKAVATAIPATNPLTGAVLDPGSIRSVPDPVIAAMLADNPISGLLVSEDGRHTLLIVSPGDDPTGTARRVTAVTQEGLELTFSGNPVVFAEVLDLMSWFLLLVPPLVIALLVLVFFSTIGDLRLSAMALIPAGLGSLWTFGLIFALGREVDIVTVIVPIFVIVMGSADGLHFVTHFQESAGSDATPEVRVRAALSEVGVPMILTTVSTAAGFLSLLVTDVEPIRQLGLFTAIGITFAGLISFFSLPAAMSHVHVVDRRHRAVLGSSVSTWIKRAARSRVPATVIVAGIVLFGLWGVPKLAVNPDQLFFFKDDDPVRLAFERTEELFGGATPLIGEFTLDPADLQGSIAAAQQASEDLEALRGVRTVFSVATLAASLSTEELTAVVSGQVDLPMGRMVSGDGMRFILLPSDFATEDLKTWITYAESSDTVVTLTGMPIVWDEIARLVLNAQATSLVVAYALVALMLAISYRRVRETVVSLVPITLTLVALLGFIAVSGIQLNLLTAVVSSIVLGVGIDYAIHFVAAISLARTDGPGYVLRAIDKAGRPIVANALGIAVGLTALWLSPLKIHLQVSMIMWVAMITAGAATLVVIPALLPREGVTGRNVSG